MIFGPNSTNWRTIFHRRRLKSIAPWRCEDGDALDILVLMTSIFIVSADRRTRGWGASKAWSPTRVWASGRYARDRRCGVDRAVVVDGFDDHVAMTSMRLPGPSMSARSIQATSIGRALDPSFCSCNTRMLPGR